MKFITVPRTPSSGLIHLPGSRSHAGWWRWLWLACHSGTHDISGSWCFCPAPHMQSPWERGKHWVNEDSQKERHHRGDEDEKRTSFYSETQRMIYTCVWVCPVVTVTALGDRWGTSWPLSVWWTQDTHTHRHTHAGRWTLEINKAAWCTGDLNEWQQGTSFPWARWSLKLFKSTE